MAHIRYRLRVWSAVLAFLMAFPGPLRAEVTPTNATLLTSSIVDLTENEMDYVVGGQSKLADFMCTDLQIATGLMFGAVTANYTAIVAQCAILAEIELIDAMVYQPVYNAVYAWLAGMHGYTHFYNFGFTEYVEVFGRIENVDLPEMSMIEVMDFSGVLWSEYCQDQGCFCDGNEDCWSMWCDDNVCMGS